MKTDKLLSSLCYFSVFFAPFLFPIIVWILTEENVRHHAGKALWIHIVPYLCIFAGLGLAALVGDSLLAIGIIIFLALVGLFYFLLNFIRGISVLL
ncbi:MAG TPA: DUF4870 domain-containing protein [Pseudogracilibacillus sp.]|nr:DUF4870 domain-containing protein [Pseudogracilibacillus sp.]